jgi:hypothetical protein
MKAVTIPAVQLEIGDRLTEWNGAFHIGPAEGPGERVSELYILTGPDGADTVEAWTDTGVMAGMPAITCSDWEAVTVWREVSR